MRVPSRVVFTEHAAERAVRLSIPFSQIADAILVGHSRRRRNVGSGDWLVRRGHLVVVYNWPDQGDHDIARAVTVWIEE